MRPVAVEGFLADSDLQRRTAAGWETIGRSPSRRRRRPEARPALVPCDRGKCRDVLLSGLPGGARELAGRLRRSVPDAESHRPPVLALVPLRTCTARPCRRATSGRCTRATGSPCRSSWTRTASRSSSGSRSHCDGTRRDWARVPKRGLASHRLRRDRIARELLPRGRASARPRVLDTPGHRDHPGLRPEAGRPHGGRPDDQAAAGPGDRCGSAVDAVRGTVGRGRVHPLPGQRADPVRAGSRRPRVPRTVAKARGRGHVLAEGLRRRRRPRAVGDHRAQRPRSGRLQGFSRTGIRASGSRFCVANRPRSPRGTRRRPSSRRGRPWRR